MYNFIGYTTLLISIAAGIYYYNKLSPRWLRLFPWFLVLSLLFELFAMAYSTYTKKSNHFIINIYTFIQFIFYLFIFYKTFERKLFKFITAWMAIIFTGYFFYNMIFGIGFFIFSAASNTFGSICVIFCCLLYFYLLFQSELNLNFFRIPMFWIATGLLFYFVGNFIYFSLVNYIIKENLDTSGKIYLFIMTILNLILYGLITAGFLSNQLWKKET